MPPQATSQTFFTYADLIEHALDYLGGTADEPATRDCLRSARQSYSEVTNSRTWSYLYTHGRVITDAPYNLGTVAYFHSGYTFGGAVYPRALVLSPVAATSYTSQLSVTDPIPFPSTGGGPGQPIYDTSWPDAVEAGWEVRVSNAIAKVERLVSPYVLTLAQDVNFEYSFGYQPIPIVANSGSITIGSPTSITFPSHGLSTGDKIIIENVTNASGTLLNINNLCSVSTLTTPTPSNPASWVVTVSNPNTFTLDGSVGSGVWDSSSGQWRRVPTHTFELYHDEYLLPADYVKSDTAISEGNFGGLAYSDPTDVLWWQKINQSSGTPRYYTITGSRYYPGRMILKFCPYPDFTKTVDFIYQRRPRDLLIHSQTAGTVSVTSGSTTATANGFVFPATCQGSIFRLGTTSAVPESWLSMNPPTFETWIYTRLSNTSVQLSDASTLTGNYRYVISDPVDVEQESTLTAVLRGVEKYLAIARNIQGKPDPFGAFFEALRVAQAADSRSYQGRVMGSSSVQRINPKYFPATFF